MVTYDEGDHDVEGESSRGIRHQSSSYNSTTLDAYRVLVVAGDEKLIALTRLSLAKNGLEVKAATTAYDGLATLDASAHDLVILDTVLPDLSGWEVLRRIRDASDVPVMLLTRRTSDVDKARPAAQGAHREPVSGELGSELHAGGRWPYRGDNRRAAAPRRSGFGTGPLRPGIRRVSRTVGGA